MAMTFHPCMKVDWSRKAVRDGFVSYDFQSGEVIGLEEETVQTSKQLRSSDDVSTFATPLAVPVYFCAGTSRVALERVRRD